MEKYYDFEENDKEKILSAVLPKKERYFKFGAMFGVYVICITVIFFISLFIFNISFYSSLWFVPEVGMVCGICSIIGGIRSKKEGEIYKEGNFKIKKGYVEKVEKRNFWSDNVTVRYKGEYRETFSQIGHELKKQDKVYVAMANQEKAPWVLPRIIKR